MTSDTVDAVDARAALEGRRRAGDIAIVIPSPRRRRDATRRDGVCGDDVVRVDWLLKTAFRDRRDARETSRRRRARMSPRASGTRVAARARVASSRERRARSARARGVFARFELDRTDDDDDALRAMRDAARAAIDVAMSHRRVARVAETKRDATVATTADVAAQAACARRLRERAATATTTFVGEETLRAVEDARVMKDVVDACAGTIGEISVEEVRSALTSRAPSAARRTVCDPLDGTKAFVSENEAEQFVFGLARVTPGVGLDRAVMIAPRVAGRWGGVGGEKGRGMFRAETRGGCVSPTGDAAADVVKRRAERCDFCTRDV